MGVLDVGSNSAHLKIVELVPGRPPRPVLSVKRPTRLGQAIDCRGALSGEAVRRLVAATGQAVRAAGAEGVDELIAFATSAVRDAANRDTVVARVADETGIELGFLPGEEEARLTFLAARSWYGWSAGRMLLLDIGGGSLEIASGEGQDPAVALSLPLGAGRLTRAHLPDDPPSRKQVRRVRRHVYAELAEACHEIEAGCSATHAAAASRIFTQLAILAGAPRAKAGPHVRRVLDRDRLRDLVPRLAKMDARRRAKLPGVSRPRARQILAGAVVAEAAMTHLGLERLDISPWALREGIMLRRQQALTDPVEATGLEYLVQRLPRQRSPHLRSVPGIGA